MDGVVRIIYRPNVHPPRSKRRWRWLLLSVCLIASAGFFLYPSLESFTDFIPAPTAVPTAPIQPVAPEQVTSARPTPTRVTPRAIPRDTQARKAAPVETGAGIAQPAKPIRQVSPFAPEGIRNRIAGEISVDVTIHVGKDGNVVSAEAAATSDGVKSYLAQRALEAARQWKFEPARLGRKAIRSEWKVRFRFRSSGVEWS